MPAKRGLNTHAVVKAAANLANTEGPEALSLSRLAQILNIRTPSLYNHVDGLTGLQRELALLNAQRLGDQLSTAVVGKSGPAAVRAVAQAFRAYIRAEPGLYRIGTQHIPGQAQADLELQAVEYRVVEIVLAVIASFDLQADDAIHAVRGLRSLVHGFTTLEIDGGFGLPLDLDESFRRLIDTYILGLVAGSPTPATAAPTVSDPGSRRI